MPAKTLRQRWTDSVNSALIPLPPPATWKDVEEGLRTSYALTDAAGAKAVRELLYPRLKAHGLLQVYEIDRAVLPMLVRMEQIGMACDTRRLKILSAFFDAEYRQICQRIEKLAGHPVNPKSDDQTSRLLFEELGVTPTRHTKGGQWSTEQKYLKARRAEHPIVNLIIKGRELKDLQSRYTLKLPLMLIDGRYHPDWKYTRTKTGRLAEEIILLIPKHTRKGQMVRSAFHATAGHLLVSVDLSQIEMRVMAHLSRDPLLLKAYQTGQDVHAMTAHHMLGAPKNREAQDEHRHRLPAKTFNFSIINGATEYSLCDQLQEQGRLEWRIDVTEAERTAGFKSTKEFLREWFKVYKGVAHYWELQKAKARKLGYVTSMFGRRSYIAGIHSSNDRIRAASERETLFPIQSSADEISKIWNARIWKEIIVPYEGAYCQPWVRVHDDTTLEVDEAQAEAVGRRMLHLVPQLLSVPTEAGLELGVRWGKLEKVPG